MDGWVRRFWQGSTDHRGTEQTPGRVVTLLAAASGHCIGMAYQVDTDGAHATMRELDFREKGGYRRERLGVVLRSGARLRALTYVAAPDNRNYLGSADLHAMATQIIGAHGPSGANLEYLQLLERALVEAGAQDLHVSMLMAAVRGRLSAPGVLGSRARLSNCGPAASGGAP